MAAGLLGQPAFSQVIPRVDPHFTHYRVYCVSPVAGSGRTGDPVRASGVPTNLNPEPNAAATNGPVVLGLYTELSDDGNWALSEIVFRDHPAARDAVTNRPSNVWAVEKGTVARAVIEAEFRKFKKNIDLNRFGAVVK